MSDIPQFIQKRNQTVSAELAKAQRQAQIDKVRNQNYDQCVEREKDWKLATTALAAALDQKRSPKKKADEWATATLKLRKAIQNAGYEGYWDIPQKDDPRWPARVWLMRDASQEEIRTLALSYHTPKQGSRVFNAEWTVIAIQFWPPFERYRVLQELRDDGITLDNLISCDNRIGAQKGNPVNPTPVYSANSSIAISPVSPCANGGDELKADKSTATKKGEEKLLPDWIPEHFRRQQYKLLKKLWGGKAVPTKELITLLKYTNSSNPSDSLRRQVSRTNEGLIEKAEMMGESWEIGQRNRDNELFYFLRLIVN